MRCPNLLTGPSGRFPRKGVVPKRLLPCRRASGLPARSLYGSFMRPDRIWIRCSTRIALMPQPIVNWAPVAWRDPTNTDDTTGDGDHTRFDGRPEPESTWAGHRRKGSR